MPVPSPIPTIGPGFKSLAGDTCVANVLRGLNIDCSNKVWGIDIPYIRLQKGWMYLVAILDWYSRYVLSWELGLTLEMPFVLSTVKLALAQAVPIMCNSDQGSHFTSPQ